MDYKSCLDYMFSQLPMYQRVGKAAYKANLDTTLALDKLFGNPHKYFKTIHIAGTNGKGSVSHMLSSVLTKSGYKTGLYTSPHLLDFRERIKINGDQINKEFIVGFINKYKPILEELKPSFFEMTVAMAFEYFKIQNVEIAVIETGMGGRLDSTNIIDPVISVITNIGKDHTEFLGETLSEIALEKAGIIKELRPVIIGESHIETAPVFSEVAKQKSASIWFADKNFSYSRNNDSNQKYQSFDIFENGNLIYKNLKTDLLGNYQSKNIVTVIQSVHTLNQYGIKISHENLFSGIKNAAEATGLAGRWQIVGKFPYIICDTAHNPEGMKLVVEQLKLQIFDNLHMVIGFVNDKNIDTILEMLPKTGNYYFTKASIPRALDSKLLNEMATLHSLKGKFYPDVKTAFQTAKFLAGKNDLIFIGGSTFVVAEAIEFIQKKLFSDFSRS